MKKNNRLNVMQYERNRRLSQAYLTHLESENESSDRIMRDLNQRMKTASMNVAEETRCAAFVRTCTENVLQYRNEMKTSRDERDQTFRETKPNDRAEERARRTLQVATEIESFVNEYSKNVLLSFEENEMRLCVESEHAESDLERETEILSSLETDLRRETETEKRLLLETEHQLNIVKHVEDESEREKRRTTMALMLLNRREEEEAEETRKEMERSIESELARRNEIENRFENKMNRTREMLMVRVREEEEEVRSRWERKRVVLGEEVCALESCLERRREEECVRRRREEEECVRRRREEEECVRRRRREEEEEECVRRRRREEEEEECVRRRRREEEEECLRRSREELNRNMITEQGIEQRKRKLMTMKTQQRRRTTMASVMKKMIKKKKKKKKQWREREKKAMRLIASPSFRSDETKKEEDWFSKDL